MTIFTVNPLNDNYLNQSFIKFCMSTWEKAGFPIKVFDYNSKEVKEAKEKYKIWIQSALNSDLDNKIAIAFDPIRLYILSLYKDMMYFDTDMIVMKADALRKIAQEEDFRVFGGNNFFCVHNGKDIKTPKLILDRCYCTDKVKRDGLVCREDLQDLKLQGLKSHAEFLHNPRIDSSIYRCLYTKSREEILSCKDNKTCFYVTDTSIINGLNLDNLIPQIKIISNMSLEERKIFKQFLENGNDYDNI